MSRNLDQTAASVALPDLPLPEPSAVVPLTMSDGAMIVLRRHGTVGAPRLALSHGNGLAINAYAPFWRLLAEHHELVLFDVRNHGLNPLHTREGHNWARIFLDFEEIYQGIQRAFGAAPTVGVFHSLSAIASLQHTLGQTEQGQEPRWAALALFDPPICPRLGHPLYDEHFADMRSMTDRASRRPESYASPQEFAAQIATRRQFARLVPDAPMALARATLRQESDGRWRLCNPRDFEASLYLSQDDTTLWPRMRGLPVPTILIGGDPTVSDTPAAKVCAALHDELGIAYHAVPDTTHFLQTERPQACVDVLRQFLMQHRLAATDAESLKG
jgi:pimeloyl-ACP methyl ester carboxylesterase